jgi:hypothetical protein
MHSKSLKSIFLLIGIALISAVVLKVINDRPTSIKAEEKIFLRLKKNSGPIIRGFQYSNYHKGRKALNIRAAKFSIEKKKIGVFQLSPFKVVRFRDAEIDFYGETDQPDEKLSQTRNALSGKDGSYAIRNDISFKGVLSREMLAPPGLKGSVSAICEPVQINFYLNDALVTMIQAEKAIIDPRRRRMILRKNIQVTSGALNLSTDRLAIDPEKGLFEIEKKYVLKTQDETITGEKLTTDFFLKKASTQ